MTRRKLLHLTAIWMFPGSVVGVNTAILSTSGWGSQRKLYSVWFNVESQPTWKVMEHVLPRHHGDSTGIYPICVVWCEQPPGLAMQLLPAKQTWTWPLQEKCETISEPHHVNLKKHWDWFCVVCFLRNDLMCTQSYNIQYTRAFQQVLFGSQSGF